jgi:glycerol-3-phosphate dehydrogenase
VVIGGGLTGAGLARDLALRGVSVLLLEKVDWGAGASGAPGDPLTGGPQHLESDRDGARAALHDADDIVRIAPHLVQRTVILLPVWADGGRAIEQMAAALEHYDRLQPRRTARPHMHLTGAEVRRLEPGLAADVASVFTLEDWFLDPHRLVWMNVLDAVRAGARAVNHSRVEALLRDGAAVIGARYRASDGHRVEARARVVVNATGAWAAEAAALADVEVRLRPIRCAQVLYDRRLSNFAISAEAADGHHLAMVPVGGLTVLGSTEEDHYGDLDAMEVRPEDVDYLVEGAERAFPAIRRHRPLRSRAGVWAGLRSPRGPSRDCFEIVDHARRDGVDGLLTVVGGRLSAYRRTAESAADVICAKLGLDARCATAARLLPGASGASPPVHELVAEHGISALAAAGLLARHGSEAPAVLLEARRGRLACRCQALTEAELAWAVASEQVRTLADAFRRLGLASGPCAGGSCVERAAEVLGHELGWSPSQRRDAAREYIVEAWRDRAPVLDRWGWAQEELAYGVRRGWPGGL